MIRFFFKLRLFIFPLLVTAGFKTYAAGSPRAGVAKIEQSAVKPDRPADWGSGVGVESPKAVACQINLGSVDTIVGLKTRAIRKVFENGRSLPEFRVAIQTLFPELSGEVENFYSRELDARLHLEEKTLLVGEGVSVLCLDNKPRAVIKWKDNDIYGSALHEAFPASVNAATALHEFRAVLNQRLGRRDPWLLPTALTGIEFLQNDEVILDPHASTGVTASELKKIVEITVRGTHGTLGVWRVSKILNGDWLVFSSRTDQERGQRKIFRWPAGEGARVIPHLMISLKSLWDSRLFENYTTVTVASAEGQTPPAHYGKMSDPQGLANSIELQLRERLANLD